MKMIPEGRYMKQEGVTIQNGVKIRILQWWKLREPQKDTGTQHLPFH